MSVNARKNYYEILGVSPDSTFAEIKSAYRKLARKYHPDVNKASESVQKFKDITEAYEILSDKFQKQKYDEIYRKNFAKDSTNTSSATESSSYRYSASSDSEFRKNAFDKIDPDIRFKAPVPRLVTSLESDSRVFIKFHTPTPVRKHPHFVSLPQHLPCGQESHNNKACDFLFHDLNSFRFSHKDTAKCGYIYNIGITLPLLIIHLFVRDESSPTSL